MKRTDVFNIVVLSFIIFKLSFAGTTGKIVGTVKDKETGAELVGVNIVLEETALGASTDTEGYFMIINVPPGNYNLKVFYIGYTTLSIENIKVSIDRTTRQEIQISPEILMGQTVVIEAERPAIEMDRTHSSSVVSADVVEYMPVTDIAEVIELQAGIVNDDGQLHFRGGRSREVTYIVDGIPVSNSFGDDGGSNITIETSSIEELEVISGTFNAEYGAAQSGIVNVVTKKPGSKFTGSVKSYIGEWLSDKDDVYLGVSDFNPMAEKDIQINLNGPIIDNQLGFFLTVRHNEYESLDWYERRYNLIDGWRIEAYKNWFQQHHAGDPDFSGVIRIPDSLKTGDGSRGPLRVGQFTSVNTKLVYNPMPELTLTYQANGYLEEYDGFDDRIDQFKKYQPDGAGSAKIWEISHFLKLQHSPWKDFFYNLSFSYQHNDQLDDDFGKRTNRKDNYVARYPGDEGIMLINSNSNGFSLGSTGGFYTDKKGKNYRDQLSLIGNFNWQVDKYNFLKAGFEVKQHFVNVYIRPYRTTQAWNNLGWPLQDVIDGSQVNFDDYWDLVNFYWTYWEEIWHENRTIAAQDRETALFKDFNIEPLEIAFYVQDKIELDDIIINAGVRFDMFQPNERVPINYRTESFNLGSTKNLKKASIKYQVSPRVGFSFPISSNGAFHGSYGHFFQLPAYRRMFNEPLVSLTHLQLRDRTLGNADLKAEKTIAYEIGLQQGITDDIAVDITAYYKDYRNLLGVEQLTTVDQVQYRRYINRDYGFSRGITFGFTKRGTFINGGINYSMSYANGSSSDPAALNLINTAIQIGGEDVQFVERKILSLDWDQRHTVNAYINFIQPNDWSLGLIGYYNTSVPYNPNFVGRYDLAEREYRNSEFKPTRWGVDLKAQKNITIFEVETVLFLKIDNLFDYLNHERVFSSTGRADQYAETPEDKEPRVFRLDQEGHFTYDEIIFSPDNYSSPRKVQLGFEIKF